MIIGIDDTIVYIKDLPDWRSQRLIALTHLIELNKDRLLRLIDSVSDHEGWLTVVWKTEPTYYQKEWVSDKWEDVGEDTRCTTHIFDNNEV